LSLRGSLRRGPVIYEIVPPRKDTSRFSTELRGVEEVLGDKRIAAINIPELIRRKEEQGRVIYSPATIPPEEYAMMIKDAKESIVNIIAPRLEQSAFLRRARRVLRDYRIPNLVLVGKERGEDHLPGPGVPDALRLLAEEKGDSVAFGGICIFTRGSSRAERRRGFVLTEPRRVMAKAEAGCDFVTSQITFDAKPATDFLVAYQRLCDESGTDPLTVFISLTTVPSTSIMSLVERLDVAIPPKVRRRILRSGDMGKESLRVAEDVFRQIVNTAEDSGVTIPLGLQVEQVGVNSGDLSLRLLDATHTLLRH
jgi:hypothetical protein